MAEFSLVVRSHAMYFPFPLCTTSIIKCLSSCHSLQRLLDLAPARIIPLILPHGRDNIRCEHEIRSHGRAHARPRAIPAEDHVQAAKVHAQRSADHKRREEQ